GRGVAYRNVQNYDLSLHDFDQAIAIEPNNAELYNSRGNTYRIKGDTSQAMADFNQRNADLEIDLTEVARATRHAVEALADQRVELSVAQREELRNLKVEVAKLGSTLAELREDRARGFQFAREKDVVELPSFLPPRRVN